MFEHSPCEICSHACYRFYPGDYNNPPEDDSYCDLEMENFDSKEGCWEFQHA